ncbi:unnamed protein product [Urochloa humidicola]
MRVHEEVATLKELCRDLLRSRRRWPASGPGPRRKMKDASSRILMSGLWSQGLGVINATAKLSPAISRDFAW